MIRRVVGATLNPVRRFFRDEPGGGAIELVLVLPIAMAIFMASMESALYMTRQIMLDRAVDMTVRNLRLGGYANPDAQLLKDEICDLATAVPDCDSEIRLELRPVSTTTWNLPNESMRCVNQAENINIPDDANPGMQNELMIVRVCIRQDAMFPGTGIGEGLSNSRGRYRIISVAAFVNEPG
jgi:hypothetical protein